MDPGTTIAGVAHPCKAATSPANHSEAAAQCPERDLMRPKTRRALAEALPKQPLRPSFPAVETRVCRPDAQLRCWQHAVQGVALPQPETHAHELGWSTAIGYHTGFVRRRRGTRR
jgi:hypothetical protein